MNTFEEALLAASVLGEYTPEEYCVIGHDLRKISMPSNLAIAGVENDSDVHVVYFKCPRMYGPTDLGEFDFRINYLNANGEGDIFPILEKDVYEDYIVFEWLIGHHACKYQGNIRFIVCARIVDNTDPEHPRITKEYNTAVHTLPVLTGLEIDTQAIYEENYDVIETILQHVEETLEDVDAALTTLAGAVHIGDDAPSSEYAKFWVKETGDEIVVPTYDEFQELDGRVQEAETDIGYVDIDLGTSGESWFQGSPGDAIVETPAASSTSYKIDLSDYIGKTVWFNLTPGDTSSNSLRLTTLCHYQDPTDPEHSAVIVGPELYTDEQNNRKQLLEKFFKNGDFPNGVLLHPTSDDYLLYISFIKAGGSVRLRGLNGAVGDIADLKTKVLLDTTLEQAGKPADAKAVGDKFKSEETFTAKTFGTNPNAADWETGSRGSQSSQNISINGVSYMLYGIRTKNILSSVPSAVRCINGFYIALYALTRGGDYIGCWNGSAFVTTVATGFSYLDLVDIVESNVDYRAYNFKLIAYDIHSTAKLTLDSAIKNVFYCDIISGHENIKDAAQYVNGWDAGKISYVNGGTASSTSDCRTDMIEFDESGKYVITPKAGYAVILNEYSVASSSTTFEGALMKNSTVEQTVIIDSSRKYRWGIKKTDSSAFGPSDLPADAITYRLVVPLGSKVEEINEAVIELEDAVAVMRSSIDAVNELPPLLLQLSAYPVYDHLFVNNSGNRVVIPHESAYHVAISRSLGYRVIEADVQITSDGHYFVNHLSDGKFGDYFSDVGGTDISNVTASDVTWSWIEEHVRYISSVPKFQTRPVSLEEFLIACKQNQMIPLLKFFDTNIAEITERIMGKNNYIVYDGTRETAGSAVILRWESNLSTIDEIIAFCDSIGKPLIFGSSKFVNTWTKVESEAIIEALHNHGYMTCISYENYSFWGQYRPMGIDFCGGTVTTNRLVSGNTYNLENVFSTNDFTITGGVISDNIITLAENGTVTCANIGTNSRQIACVDLEVDFDGVLTLTGGLGEFRGNIDYDSANGKLIVCTAVINKSVNFILTAKGGNVTIRNIKYKVSIL